MEDFMVKDHDFKLIEDPLDYSKIVWINFKCGKSLFKRSSFIQWCTSPGDVILDWEEFKDPSSENLQANILLKLGGTQLPPAELVLDRYASKAERLGYWHQDIESCVQKTTVDKERFGYEMKQRFTEFEYRFYTPDQKERPYRKIANYAFLQCKVIYAHQMCHVCRTIDHSSKNCPKRGCTLCESPNHPFQKCPNRCSCGGFPAHLQVDHQKFSRNTDTYKYDPGNNTKRHHSEPETHASTQVESQPTIAESSNSAAQWQVVQGRPNQRQKKRQAEKEVAKEKGSKNCFEALMENEENDASPKVNQTPAVAAAISTAKEIDAPTVTPSSRKLRSERRTSPKLQKSSSMTSLPHQSLSEGYLEDSDYNTDVNMENSSSMEGTDYSNDDSLMEPEYVHSDASEEGPEALSLPPSCPTQVDDPSALSEDPRPEPPVMDPSSQTAMSDIGSFVTKSGAHVHQTHKKAIEPDYANPPLECQDRQPQEKVLAETNKGNFELFRSDAEQPGGSGQPVEDPPPPKPGRRPSLSLNADQQ